LDIEQEFDVSVFHRLHLDAICLEAACVPALTLILELLLDLLAFGHHSLVHHLFLKLVEHHVEKCLSILPYRTDQEQKRSNHLEAHQFVVSLCTCGRLL
jgi:hypothetical protein